MASSERKIICGLCMKEFIQISDTEWKGNCKHRKDVIAHVGADPKNKFKK